MESELRIYIYSATGYRLLITGLGRKYACCWATSEMQPELPEVHPISHFMDEADRVFVLTFYLHPVLRLMLHAASLPNPNRKLCSSEYCSTLQKFLVKFYVEVIYPRVNKIGLYVIDFAFLTKNQFLRRCMLLMNYMGMPVFLKDVYTGMLTSP